MASPLHRNPTVKRDLNQLMNARQILAVLLILFGSLTLAYGRISYTRQKTVIDIGSVKVQRETHESIPLPLVLGGLVLASGLLLVVWRRKA